MAQHLVAYSQSIASTAFAARNAVADQSVRVSGVDILVPPGFARLAAVYAQGPDLAQAQLASPALRRRFPFDVSPLDVGATPTGPLFPWVDMFDRTIALDVGEQLNFLASNVAAGANIQRGLVWLSDGDLSIPGGEIFTFRLTGTTTLVAETWTTTALTLVNQLPYGTYAVVGCRAQSATGIGARLVFPGPIFARPGVICANTVTEMDLQRFRVGRCGNFGQFVSIAPPTIEFLATAGDTAETVHLDLIKVG